MKKKCLFVVSEYPFPARNGVTIPSSNYIKLLEKKNYTIDIILVSTELFNNDRYYNVLQVIPHRNKITSYFKELTLQEAYFNSYHYNISKINEFLKVNGPYDMIVASPINVTSVAQTAIKKHLEIFGTKPFSIAGISDCYTTVLNTPIINNHFSVNLAFKNIFRKTRSLSMAMLEYKAIKNFDQIFVQTSSDKEQIERISKNKLKDKVLIFTNGVDQQLFSINSTYNRNFLFVASLKVPHYQNTLLWFYQNVWKSAISDYSNCKLYVYAGGGFPEEIFEEMILDKSVVFVKEFVKDIKDIYIGKSVCIAPIFKNYGFINKVAEAMSSGLVVIGDKSAFNGILGYENNQNVIVANSSDEYIKAIKSILKNKEYWKLLSVNSKLLALNEFSWDSKSDFFDIQ